MRSDIPRACAKCLKLVVTEVGMSRGSATYCRKAAECCQQRKGWGGKYPLPVLGRARMSCVKSHDVSRSATLYTILGVLMTLSVGNTTLARKDHERQYLFYF